MLINQNSAYHRLEEALGYAFRDRNLLLQALTHRSRANEAGRHIPDNQRLEFLGDSILGFIVGADLYLAHPTWREGELSRKRSALVDEENLARLAISIELGDFLLLGRGEEMGGGRKKGSILADAFEALIAAVYLDGGIDAARDIVSRQFAQLILANATEGLSRDYKTELQEITQSRFFLAPRYELLDSSGPDHERSYRVAVYLGDELAGEGGGRSKKAAQQAAARQALEKLG